MEAKSELLRRIGWSQDLIDLFMVDDLESIRTDSLVNRMIDLPLETQTSTIQFETANSSTNIVIQL